MFCQLLSVWQLSDAGTFAMYHISFLKMSQVFILYFLEVTFDTDDSSKYYSEILRNAYLERKTNRLMINQRPIMFLLLCCCHVTTPCYCFSTITVAIMMLLCSCYLVLDLTVGGYFRSVAAWVAVMLGAAKCSVWCSSKSLSCSVSSGTNTRVVRPLQSASPRPWSWWSGRSGMARRLE